jgi:peptidoglycan/LPS O-acetylase OafA/YrhL
MLISGELFCFFCLLLTSTPLEDTMVEIMKHPLRTICFGALFNGPVWYLYALLKAYLIFTLCIWICKKNEKICHILKNDKFQNLVIVLTLTIQIYGRFFVQKYNLNNYMFIFRSALFYAIPFMLLGRQIRRKNISFSRSICVAGIGIGFIVSAIEYVAYKQYLDVYLGTVIISIFLFCLFLEIENIKVFNILRFIGKYLSDRIFLYHAAFIVVVDSIAPTMNGYLRPILTLTVTILFALIMYELEEKMRVMYVKRHKTD